MSELCLSDGFSRNMQDNGTGKMLYLLIMCKEKKDSFFDAFPYQLKLVAVIYMEVISVLKYLSYLRRMKT
jgi:hypothetical protein